jgi:tetratricopeptide (TPR) repeat protein
MLLERCLAWEQGDRPSAAELAAALKQQFAPAARLRRWAVRRPLAAASVACVLVLAAGAAGWSAANRDPAVTRAYTRGVAAYQAGHFAEADRHFDAALGSDPDHVASWYARGRARLAQGNVSLALTCFEEANRRRPNDPRTLACLAYGYALEENHRPALLHANEAWDAGATSAAVLNNRAYSKWKTADHRGALKDLDEALALAPDLLPARYNRAMCGFVTRLRDRNFPLEQALADVAFLLERVNPSGELLKDAALLYAAASNHPDDEHANLAVNYVGLALSRGAPRAKLEDLILKRKLQGNPRYAAALETPFAAEVPPIARLCDPIAGLSD